MRKKETGKDLKQMMDIKREQYCEETNERRKIVRMKRRDI